MCHCEIERTEQFKRASLDEEWTRLEEFERLNRGNVQLRTIRSRHTQRAINVLGCPDRMSVVAHNGNTGKHYE